MKRMDVAQAQFNLGLMYFNGKGVLEDYVQAYAWFNIAATQGDEPARKAKPLLAQMMTPSQIEKGSKVKQGALGEDTAPIGCLFYTSVTTRKSNKTSQPSHQTKQANAISCLQPF